MKLPLFYVIAIFVLYFWAMSASAQAIDQPPRTPRPDSLVVPAWVQEACIASMNDADRVVVEMINFKEKFVALFNVAKGGGAGETRKALLELQNTDRRVANYLKWYERNSYNCLDALGLDDDRLQYRNPRD